MKKLLSFFLIATFIVALYGCHTDGHAPFIDSSTSNVAVENKTVDDTGKFADIVFNHTDSGQTRISCDPDTLQSGVKVEVTETHTKSQTLSHDGTTQTVYIYRIDAYLETKDALGNITKTPVDSLAKPLKITLPTEHLGKTGICYVGIKYSEKEEWQYRKVTENGYVTLNTRLSMASTNQLQREYDCRVYKMGIYLALFLYNPTNTSEVEPASIASVNSITATSTKSVTIADDVYSDDLELVLNMEGENLGNLNAKDVTVTVTYRSDSESPSKIKVNGREVTRQEKKSDDAVTGKGYTYSFELDKPSSFDFIDSLKATLKYKLGIKGLALKEFPNEFLVELKGVIPDGLIKTFGYSEYFTFDTSEDDGSVTVAVKTDEANFADVENELYVVRPTFKITSENHTFTEAEKEAISNADITISGVASSKITKTWDGNNFVISFTEDLPYDTEFTLSIPETISGDMHLNAFNFTFKTVSKHTLDLIKGTGIATVTGAGIYQAGVEVTVGCTLLDGYENAVWTGYITTETFNMPAKNATMTANATPINYTLTYNLDGGQLATNNPASYTIETATFTLNNPTRDGYTFLGWTGTGIEEGTATETVTIQAGSTGERSYTATWFKADLAFDLGNGVKLYMNKVTQGNSVWYAGIFEVTQAQYYAVMGTKPSNFPGNDRPVEEVSWNDIMAENGFIAKLNASDTIQAYLSAKGLSGYQFTLPTQEQWEYTCRAGSTGDYGLGESNTTITTDNLGEYAWYFSNSESKTHTVGTRTPNAWGFYDMHGNVWEWTLTKDDSMPIDNRIVCGGSWYDYAADCRSSSYSSLIPDFGTYYFGFRVALVAPSN